MLEAPPVMIATRLFSFIGLIQVTEFSFDYTRFVAGLKLTPQPITPKNRPGGQAMSSDR
jgi:hypothetical protein